MTTPIIEATGLNVWLQPPDGAPRIHVLRDVSLSVRPGERLGLVGESGCGKSTTLLSLIGLLPIGARLGGSIRLDGEELMREGPGGAARLDAIRGRDVAMVMQSAMNALNPVQRIDDQIREAMRPEIRMDGRLAPTRCRELIERVGLPDRVASCYPHELSGGMRQRVGIAMGLAPEPRLLLADEPTTALDTIVQARIMELLDELCADLQLAVVLVSHHLALATAFCDTVAVMYSGRVVEYAASDTIIAQPAHPYTKLLFAATPDIDTDKDEIRSIPGAPPSLALEDHACAFSARCPAVHEACVVRPDLREADERQRVACQLVGGERGRA
jgi:peptide/nickel transport system ATP-binding protein